MSKEQAKKIAELLHGLDQKAVQALAVGRYEDFFFGDTDAVGLKRSSVL